MISIEKFPIWTQDFLEKLSTTQQFALYNNIHDFYPYHDEEYGYITYSLPDYLAELLQKKGYKSIIVFEPTKGLKLLKGETALLDNFGFTFDASRWMKIEKLETIYILLKKLFEDEKQMHAVIFNFASYLKELKPYQEEYNEFLFHLFHYSFYASPIYIKESSFYNQFIFLLEDEKGLPHWYKNSKIDAIQIAKPDIQIRKSIIRFTLEKFENYKDVSLSKREQLIKELATITEGMYAKELLNILLSARDKRVTNLIEFLLQNKLQASKNPWEKFDTDFFTHLKKRIQKDICIGNSSAIDAVIHEIESASLNFSNITEGNSFLQNPRSVMLLSGYHKDAQRELASLLAEEFFDTPDACCHINLQNYGDTKEIESFLSILTEHTKTFHYGILLLEDIQKADAKVLQEIFGLIKEAKYPTKQGTLYLHGYFIMLTYSPSIIAQQEEESQEKKLHNEMQKDIENFFIALDEYAFYQKVQNKIVIFNLLTIEEAKLYLQQLITTILEKVGILHQLTIVIKEELKQQIIALCLENQRAFETTQLKIKLHKQFVMPLTQLFIDINSQKYNLIILEKLYKDRFEVELA